MGPFREVAKTGACAILRNYQVCFVGGLSIPIYFGSVIITLVWANKNWASVGSQTEMS